MAAEKVLFFEVSRLRFELWERSYPDKGQQMLSSALTHLRERRDPYPFDDGSVLLIVIQEVVRGIKLDPDQQWGVFANPLLEQRKRLLTITKLGMEQGEVNRGNMSHRPRRSDSAWIRGIARTPPEIQSRKRKSIVTCSGLFTSRM